MRKRSLKKFSAFGKYKKYLRQSNVHVTQSSLLSLCALGKFRTHSSCFSVSHKVQRIKERLSWSFCQEKYTNLYYSLIEMKSAKTTFFAADSTPIYLQRGKSRSFDATLTWRGQCIFALVQHVSTGN